MDNLDVGRVWRWASKGGFAVLDQGLFAGTNFVVGVLLSRWTAPSAYGAFSTAYAAFLFLGTFHTALWSEPMLVFGSGRYRDRYGAYQGILVAYHWRFAGTVGLALALVAALFWSAGQAELATGFLGLALGAPLVLYLWLVRRSAYVILKPQLAAYGGGLYLALYLGMTMGLRAAGWLNPGSALVSMGVAALFAAALVQVNLRSEARIGLKLGAPPARPEVRALHWEYGRWALVAGGLSWVPANVYFVTLPVSHGLEASGALKALMNLVQPALHLNMALGGLLVPVFVRALQEGSVQRFSRLGLIMLAGGSTAYGLGLVLLGPRLAVWLYAGVYSFPLAALVLTAVVPISLAVISVCGGTLRALGMPKYIALGWGTAALVAVVVGVPLSHSLGLSGSIPAMALSYLAGAISLAVVARTQLANARRPHGG